MILVLSAQNPLQAPSLPLPVTDGALPSPSQMSSWYIRRDQITCLRWENVGGSWAASL